MYNGIGLQTARGSGTSGYVQKNLSVGSKKLQSKQQFLKELEQKRKNNLPPQRKANQAIVEHERKRQIMIQMLKLRQKLQDEGLKPQEIEQKVQKAQEILNKKLQSGKIQSKTNDTHVLTEAKQKQYMKLSKAFGVTEKRSVGSAFDFQAQREQKLKRQYEKSLQPNFECPKDNCGKVYREKQLLDRHLKYKHPEIYEKLKQLQKEEKQTKQKKELKQKGEKGQKGQN